MSGVRRRTVRVLLATGLAAAPAPVVAAAGVPATLVFHLADHRIDEASGIAPGRVSPGVFYVQNDSGDSSRFFALDATSGATLATVDVPHARNVDWEDIAAAPDRAGVPSVWLADIGDNDATRDEVQVYRVDEPRITGRTGTVHATRPDVWRLRYPGGPVNAESFAVTPRGDGYVVTKSVLGSSQVYRLPPRPDADHVQLLSPVASIRFGFTGTAGGPGPFGQVTATSAAFSADGSLFAVRTYTDAYVWRVGAAGLAAALRTPPARVALPAQPQGEGIAVVGTRLVVDSEGRGSAVWSVPVPVPVPSAGVPAPGTASGTGSPERTPGPPGGTAGGGGTGVAAAPHAGGGHGAAPTATVVGGVAAVVGVALLGAGTWAIRRRRGRSTA